MTDQRIGPVGPIPASIYRLLASLSEKPLMNSKTMTARFIRQAWSPKGLVACDSIRQRTPHSEVCDAMFARYNRGSGVEADFDGPSMSVGDIVEIEEPDRPALRYLCAPVGWTLQQAAPFDASNLLERAEEQLARAGDMRALRVVRRVYQYLNDPEWFAAEIRAAEKLGVSDPATVSSVASLLEVL